MFRVFLLLFCFVSTLNAQRVPRITASPLHLAPTDPVEIRGSGFTPSRLVVSHLRRPDGTEYGVLWILTNAQGEFSHPIDTLLLLPGTHELWIVDEAAQVTSNTVRFTIGFQAGTPVLPEVRQALTPYIGTWRGDGARNSPAVPTAILMTLSGGDNGPTAGTIAYPSLSCGAVLTFRAISADFVEFFETSTYGTERCVGNGIVTVKTAPDGSLAFQWRNPNLKAVPGTASGKLVSLR